MAMANSINILHRLAFSTKEFIHLLPGSNGLEQVSIYFIPSNNTINIVLENVVIHVDCTQPPIEAFKNIVEGFLLCSATERTFPTWI